MEVLSLLYLLAFALSGIMISSLVFFGDRPLRRIFYGLVFGLAMLLWLPVLFAFLLDFTLLAQLLALLVAVCAGAVCFILRCKRIAKRAGYISLKDGFKQEDIKKLLWTTLPLLAIGWILLLNHTIVPASNGSLHVGQSTYGDLCMHLGFISSISVQQTFPPQYSIFPGTALGYPFLCDSVSSTFYTLGSSLRFATLLPAMYAYLIVVFGVYLFFESWFKRSSVASFATYLFFIGGGLGFAYIFNNQQILAASGIDRWKEFLEGFYKAPTNIPAEGLRWVNSIADMMVPQRATLFGWALLFPCLQLLYRAAMEREFKLFIPLGILAGCLPLVHTHSFLALGIISVFLIIGLFGNYLRKNAKTPASRLAVPLFGMAAALLVFGIITLKTNLILTTSATAKLPKLVLSIMGAAFAVITILCTLSEYRKTCGSAEENPKQILFTGAVALIGIIASTILMQPLNGNASFGTTGLLVAALFTAFTAVMVFWKGIDWKHDSVELKRLGMFLLFGVITAVLAAPQLIGFTFKQSVGEQFTRWNFNWDNTSDSWLWFYIKNLGLIFIFMLPAFLSTSRRSKAFYGGSLLIWLICELVLFQPNPYDNNKLLFVWFAFTCGIVAEYLCFLFKRLTKACSLSKDERKAANGFTGGSLSVRILALFVLVALFLSGTLTLVREYISGDHIGSYTAPDGSAAFGYTESGYEVVPASMVKLTEFIKKNTEPDAIFLTNNNHNNAIAMLTGRNIFCGSGTFLFYHGVNFSPRQAMLKSLYETPEMTLLATAEEYGIDYVLVASYERGNYDVDIDWFQSNLKCIYSEDGILLFSID